MKLKDLHLPLINNFSYKRHHPQKKNQFIAVEGRIGRKKEMDIKIKTKEQGMSTASTEAKPEGANSWRLEGKSFLLGNQSGTPDPTEALLF